MMPEEIDATTKEQRLRQIDDLTVNTMVDLSNFIFNRDEANNFDERPRVGL